jgi:glycerophosphoryl diester phosphodiesterase
MAAADVADMVEVDIRSTADGTLILTHDAVIGGMTVSDTSWARLATIDVGDGHHPVELSRVLTELPNFPLNLEIKNFPGEPGHDPEHSHALRTAALARPDDLLTCFFWPSVDAVRLSYPEVATGLLLDRGWSLPDAVDHALEQGHGAVVPQYELALSDPTAVRSAVDAGLVVAVWTLNDSSIARELASIGVTAIITDDPGQMRRELRDMTTNQGST